MAPPAAPLTTNQKILTWARGKLGQQIGIGECWDLGESALKQAGAKTSTDLGPIGADDDYIWGDEETDLKKVGPGDILQLRDHKVTTSTETVYTFADGTEDTDSTSDEFERPHHTAIVDTGLDANGVFKTLEQNVKPSGKVVQNKSLITADQPDVVTFSKAKRLNPTTKKVETATVKTTVSVTVTGTIKAYHPKS